MRSTKKQSLGLSNLHCFQTLLVRIKNGWKSFNIFSEQLKKIFLSFWKKKNIFLMINMLEKFWVNSKSTIVLVNPSWSKIQSSTFSFFCFDQKTYFCFIFSLLFKFKHIIPFANKAIFLCLIILPKQFEWKLELV